MSQRTKYDNVVIDTNGNALANAQVDVYTVGTTTPVSIFSTRSGGGTIANPIVTTSTGLVSFWVPPGTYDIKFSDTLASPRFSTRTVTFEAVSGDTATGGIAWTQMEAGTASKVVQTDASGDIIFADIATAGIPADSITSTQIGPSAVTASELATNAVTSTKILDGAVTNTKILDGSVTNAKLDSAITLPSGLILDWPGAAAPSGWTLCQGQAVARTGTYAAIFAVIGTAYGAGDGSSTFNLPDFRGRVAVGLGTHADNDSRGDSDGLAVGSRTTNHSHSDGTLVVASHNHAVGTLAVSAHTHAVGTLVVASHAHAAGTIVVDSHSHGAGTLAASHSHGVGTYAVASHTHAAGTLDADSHTHGAGSYVTGGGDSGSIWLAPQDTNGGGVSIWTHTHDVAGTSSATAPGINGSTAATAPALSGSSATVSPTFTGSTATFAPATSGNTASVAPAVSGSTASTTPTASGSTANTAPDVTGATGTATLAYLVTNKIIRH